MTRSDDPQSPCSMHHNEDRHAKKTGSQQAGACHSNLEFKSCKELKSLSTDNRYGSCQVKEGNSKPSKQKREVRSRMRIEHLLALKLLLDATTKALP